MDRSYSCPTNRKPAARLPPSHQRVGGSSTHLQTDKPAARLPIPPTRCSFILATEPAAASGSPIHQRSGGSLILTYGTGLRSGRPPSHQRSWYLHTQPPNGQAHDRLPNPTNAVGGSFILSYNSTSRPLGPPIPPTQLVDRSYSTDKQDSLPPRLPPNHPLSWDRSYPAYKQDWPLVPQYQQTSWENGRAGARRVGEYDDPPTSLGDWGSRGVRPCSCLLRSRQLRWWDLGRPRRPPVR